MQTSSRAAGYADREVTHAPNWHLLVQVDFFLNAVTTGLFLVTAVAELAKPDLFGPLARWAYPIALVVLLADLACLVLDLGNPARFHHMLRVFKPLSPMSLGTWCLTAYSLPLTLLVAVDLLGGPHWLRAGLIVVGLPFAFGSAAYKGVLFSTTAQPGWRDARWLGAYHVTGALVAGGAVLLLLAVATGHDDAAALLGRAELGLVVLNLVTQCLLESELAPAFDRAYGPAARVGAAVVLLAGAVLPVWLIADGGATRAGVGAVLLLLAGFAIRSAVVRVPHAFD